MKPSSTYLFLAEFCILGFMCIAIFLINDEDTETVALIKIGLFFIFLILFVIFTIKASVHLKREKNVVDIQTGITKKEM